MLNGRASKQCVGIEDDDDEDEAVIVVGSELEEEVEEKDRKKKLQRDLVFPAEDGAASVAESGVDDVGLDLEVDSDEIDQVGGVGMDSTDLGGGDDDVAGALSGEEGLDVGLASEVEQERRGVDSRRRRSG
ncbi:hypothetical protein Cni_G16275 [Canna indica]|uniref:Uncharacterized protein n=1 Tax=Canna indica TaxID=4628 RepID=A0AAQ3QFI1_9LILI|nr:hypothetical protein Cni_G16275 [Canna indica]